MFLLAVGIFRACIEIHPDENSTIYSSFQKTLSLRKFNTIARLFSLPCHNVDSKEREKKKLFRCLRSFGIIEQSIIGDLGAFYKKASPLAKWIYEVFVGSNRRGLGLDSYR